MDHLAIVLIRWLIMILFVGIIIDRNIDIEIATSK